MKFFVPYDGTALARAALERASTFGESLGTDVHAVTVIPKSRDYAREKGWIDENESFEVDRIEQRIEAQVTDLAPAAAFESIRVHKHINAGGIATRLRDRATEYGADVVVLGSENVGSIAAPVGSIGSNVATRVEYDIYLVQSV